MCVYVPMYSSPQPCERSSCDVGFAEVEVDVDMDVVKGMKRLGEYYQ